MDENKIIEHGVRLDRAEKDITKLTDEVHKVKDKQARLESVQMVTLEKLGSIESTVKETYNKLEEAENSELNSFDKYKFWIITGLITGLVGLAIKLL